MKESLKESARDNSITLKKSIVTKSTPLLKQDEPRTQDADRLNKAIEDLKRKTAASEGGGSVVSGQGTASLMNRYYALIWSRVRQNWALPSSLVSDKNLEAIIDVTVLRDGTVTGMRFEKRSGNSYFDTSAERAIQKSDPFPALPTWIQDSSVELGIRFRSADYKR